MINKKIIFICGLMSSFFLEADSPVLRLANDHDAEGEVDYDEESSYQIVEYQPPIVSAPVRVAAPAQNPAFVMDELRKEAQELAQLMDELNAIIQENSEKQRDGLEEVSDVVADLAKDVTAANSRKDRIEEVSLLMDASRSA